jgi:hypothetical protein
MAYRCGACRRGAAGVFEGAIEPGLPDVRLRLLLCAACGAPRACSVGLDPWRGAELEAMALRPEDREAAGHDALVELALDLLAEEASGPSLPAHPPGSLAPP